jgi:hypothetical protein
LAAAGLLPLRADEHGHAVVLFEGSRMEGVDSLLCPPADWAIDLECATPEHGLERMPARLLVRVATSLTTSQDVVGMVVDALGRRLPRFAAIAVDVRFALQEAVGNAVMHGNLSLDGRLRASRQGLTEFTRTMQLRLADPRYALRPVTITADWNRHHVLVRVEDCGRGFSVPVRIQPVPPDASCGRGIGQIRDLCDRVTFTRGGRRVTMRFVLPPGEGAQPAT